jgi:hypothetical protein
VRLVWLREGNPGWDFFNREAAIRPLTEKGNSPMHFRPLRFLSVSDAHQVIRTALSFSKEGVKRGHLDAMDVAFSIGFGWGLEI